MSKRNVAVMEGSSLDKFFKTADVVKSTFPATNDDCSIDQVPLAERQRPRALSEFVLNRLNCSGSLAWFVDRLTQGIPIPSVILCGPPGCGKTTLALLAANAYPRNAFVKLSAVSDGVGEVRKAIASNGKTVTTLFIDEIHRFSKAQQDALLHAIEGGKIILIGATTENPATCLNKALLSRCKVIHLPKLQNEDIAIIVERALQDQPNPPSTEYISSIIRSSGGDARRALNILSELLDRGELDLDVTTTYAYDAQKRTEYISAFQKSIRGSDKDAATFYLVAMLESGEDPMYVARRLVRIASEDVGIANPNALTICVSAMQATATTGMPECNTALGLATVYLCNCAKSNAIELACLNAKDAFHRHKDHMQVPSYISSTHANGYIYTNQPKPTEPLNGSSRPQRYLPSGVHDVIFPDIN